MTAISTGFLLPAAFMRIETASVTRIYMTMEPHGASNCKLNKEKFSLDIYHIDNLETLHG